MKKTPKQGQSWPTPKPPTPGAQHVLYRRRLQTPPRQAPLGPGRCVLTPGSRKKTVDAPVLGCDSLPEERGGAGDLSLGPLPPSSEG